MNAGKIRPLKHGRSDQFLKGFIFGYNLFTCSG